MRLENNILVFESRFFEFEGRRMEITATNANPHYHRIKGEKEVKEISNETLIALFRAGRLKASDGATGNERGG